jgi:hypothetical protein
MKRWFWVVGCDNTTTDPFVADAGELGCDDRELRICRKVELWPGTAWVKATTTENDGETDDVLQTCYIIPIYSRRLRAALEKHGIGGIQYLPINVYRPSGELIPDFSVANVLNCVDALDLRLSAVSRFPEDYLIASRRGLIRGINAPVLRADQIAQYDIIRLSTYPVSLYVSERFVTVFEAGHFTGCSFQETPTVDRITSSTP